MMLGLGTAQTKAQRTQEQELAAFDAAKSAASRGVVADCNSNNISDELDIIAGTSQDFNSSGVPDECEPFTKLTASDADENDRFGHSVSVSGDTAVFGASEADGTETRSGAAYVFRFDGWNWSEEQKLTASDGARNDEFGYSISVSGNTVIVGAHDDEDAGNHSGAAYVFRFNGTNWVEVQKLTPSDASTAHRFGYSVSVSGNAAIVGDPGDNDDGGSAYFFRFNGTNWVEEQKVTGSAPEGRDQFGAGVSISGDTAIVGMGGDDDGMDVESNFGSVFIYQFDGTSWVEEQKLTASDAAEEDHFGRAVSISGDTAFVGSLSDDGAGLYSGSVYVFGFDGTSWVEEQKLTASDAVEGDRFGQAVSVSGNTIVVGAHYNNNGSAYLFRFDGTSWSQARKLTAPDGAVGDLFGNSVSISGDQIALGAWRDDDNGSNSGSAHLFYDTAPGSCTDEDCDGYGSPGDASCRNGSSEDCDDGDPGAYPGNSETTCNGADDDCDPSTLDEPDNDGDGVTVCSDCDDGNPDSYPGNDETTCNGIDDDCDPATSDAPSGVDVDCNANGLPDECDIASGASSDIDGDGVPDECIPVPPAIALAPHDAAKNRYISISPNNGPIPVALQVTLSDGRTCWVSEPCLRSDTSDIDPQWVAECVESSAGDGSDMARDWSAYTDPVTGDPVVHVRGCVILPNEVYLVRAMAVGLLTSPLAIGTVPTPTISGSWANIVGDFDSGTGLWGPPDNATGFKDIAASVQAFQGLGTLPVTWADIAPYGDRQANYAVSFSDIGAVIQGFQGVPYSGTVATCVIPAAAETCP